MIPIVSISRKKIEKEKHPLCCLSGPERKKKILSLKDIASNQSTGKYGVFTKFLSKFYERKRPTVWIFANFCLTLFLEMREKFP